MRARDTAKIGSVYLHKSRWQERQLVPETWIETSTTRHIQDTPWGPPGVYGYGYFVFPGKLHQGSTVIRAVGNGDQRIFVLPDDDLSVTVFAGNYNNFRVSAGERILAKILDARS